MSKQFRLRRRPIQDENPRHIRTRHIGRKGSGLFTCQPEEADTGCVVGAGTVDHREINPSTKGLVVGRVGSDALVHLRVAGSDETLCARGTALEWPSRTFRSSGCFSCLAIGLEAGYVGALDTDGAWLMLNRLLE